MICLSVEFVLCDDCLFSLSYFALFVVVFMMIVEFERLCF